jgi:hypothetical protein
MARPRHAYVVRDAATIPPLDAPAAEAWFLGGTLASRMQRVLEGAGLTVERVSSLEEAAARAGRHPEGALVTHDSVAFSRSVVRGLLDGFARGEARAVVAALPEARATTTLSHVAGLERVDARGTPAFTAPIYALRGGADPRGAEPLLLPYKEIEWKLPVPVGMLGHAEEPFAGTDTYMVRVDHWSHVLRVNIAALVAQWFERAQSAGGKLWYLWRALLGFPWRRGRLAGAIRAVHRKAQVHHRAHVELSVVEEGAIIGANAIVKGSYVARGARIDDGAIVNASVVGENAFVANGAALMCCVLFPGAFAAQQKMQFAVLGPSSVAFTGSFFYDLNFDRNVQVMHRGKLVDAGTRFLSVCLGPWARVAGGVWVASGREIPAHALVVQPPGLVLHKVDAALAQTHMTTIADKQLVGLGELPKKQP